MAEAGVLLATVTQIKDKVGHRYLGVDIGMNSLPRPADYSAYHPIVNLTGFDARASLKYPVVGPICETGDVLEHSRPPPESREGDVLLIGNAGAYGCVTSSAYNLRPATEETVLCGRPGQRRASWTGQIRLPISRRCRS